MKTMKTTFILCLAMLFNCLAYGKTTEISFFIKKKTPWQSLMSVMHSHGMDTTNLNVLSYIPLTDIEEISPDLAKTYRVSKPIKYYDAEMLGTIITDYMIVKYGNRNKEKYDYYKNRFNPDFDVSDYETFVSTYPNSRYADELKSKALCLEEQFSWIRNNTYEKSQEIFRKYEDNLCLYIGYVSIANDNMAYRRTIEDWEQLQMQLAYTDRLDCAAYYTFMDSHFRHLQGFYKMISDSISQCQQRQQQKAWLEACIEHTVDGYENYLLLYPYSQEANEAKRRIEDITAWQQAVSENTHESYSYYYNEFPSGDSVNVAGERMKIMEEPAWQKAQKQNTIASYESFLNQYPNGYYSNLALNQQLELEIKKFNCKKGGAITKMELIGVCSQQAYSWLCFGNVGKDYDINILLQGSTPVKVALKPGQSHWARVKNGQYKIYVTSSNGSEWEENGHGSLNVEDGVYAQSWYSYAYNTLFPTITIINKEAFIDQLALNNFSEAAYNRAQLEVNKLSEKDMDSKRKVLRNVTRQKLEEANNQIEYEKIIRETEDDENVNLMLKNILFWIHYQ